MIEDEHQPYDKSSKWLIQHHGDSLLRLAKIENIQAWRPAPAEIVPPRQWPDGLLDVRLQGESQDNLFLLEIATYAESPRRRVDFSPLRWNKFHPTKSLLDRRLVALEKKGPLSSA